MGCKPFPETLISKDYHFFIKSIKEIILKKLNDSIFIQKSKKVHGDKYDYSKVKYINCETKVCIKCPKHGYFWQQPQYHIGKQKSGCPSCANENRNNYKRLNTTKFIKEAIKIYGNKYDYSLVNCKNNYDNVTIICPIHGKFEQRPTVHLRKNGKGCPKCCVNYKKSLEDYLKVFNNIHGDKYDYSLVNNINNGQSMIDIICPLHGIFKQRAILHYRGHGCKFCANKENGLNHRISVENFIEKSVKIHGDTFDYSLIKEIENVQIGVPIKCKEHNEIFYQRPDNHMNGKNGCKKCKCMGISHLEKEMINFVKENYSNNIKENVRNIITPYELDIYLPDLKLAFEFNGLYWHSELYKDKNYHLNKTEQCEEIGIHLVHIYEDDWIYKQEVVKSRILNLLGKSKKVYARKTEIKEVSYKDSKEFLEQNHIQGNCMSKIRFGLYYQDELVSLMTFGKLRKCLGNKNKEGSFELLRFCNKINTNVVGGASKLFKYFIGNYCPKDVISYADRSWTMNNGQTLYDKLGFDLDSISKPNYFYINNIKENRFKYRKDKLIEDGFDENMSEREIMTERKIYRIYNSGQLKYKYLQR